MTDTIHTESEQLSGRKLALAFNELMVEVADYVDSCFPHDGNKQSTTYATNYEAMSGAFRAIRAVVIAPPPNSIFREQLLSFVVRAFSLTGGFADHDEMVRKCIDRASDDYKIETPDELRRTGKAARPVAAATPAASAKGKP